MAILEEIKVSINEDYMLDYINVYGENVHDYISKGEYYFKFGKIYGIICEQGAGGEVLSQIMTNKLFDDKTLTYWTDLHYERNNSLLDEIVASYNHLREEEDERDLCFENLVEAFDNLELFDLSLSEVEGLSSKSIDTLTEYNNSIENLKNKFNEIKDELAIKIGIIENI